MLVVVLGRAASAAGALRRLPRAVPMMVGVVLLVLFAMMSAGGESAVRHGAGWNPGVLPPGQPNPSRRIEFGETELPAGLRTVVAVGLLGLMLLMGALIILGAFVLVLGVRFRIRRRRQVETANVAETAGDESEVDLGVLRRAAGGARQRLRDRVGGDPGDAVERAWLTLEEAAADCGLARKPAQTPTEFTTSVLAGLDVDGAALGRLRRLYQRARFSGRPVTEADVGAALVALDTVVDGLDRTAEQVR